MKLFTTIALFVLLATLSVNATTYVVPNGSYNPAAYGITFQNGDSIIIAGNSVTCNTSVNISQSIVVKVTGKFHINPGNGITMTLGAGSKFYVAPGGEIKGADASQKIIIGTNHVFTGNNTVAPPTYMMYATSSTVGFVSMQPLPLKFISFNIDVKSSSSLLLRWEAVNDGPANAFAIEQSTDGINYNEVAAVMAGGGDHEAVKYAYELKNVQVGKSMYRIRHTSIDNKEIVYSPVKQINISGAANTVTTAAVSAQSGKINILLTNATAATSNTVIISTVDGKILANQQFNAQDTNLSLPVTASGLLIVTVTDGSTYKASSKVFMP